MSNPLVNTDMSKLHERRAANIEARRLALKARRPKKVRSPREKEHHRLEQWFAGLDLRSKNAVQDAWKQFQMRNNERNR
jgi:hypothetical protein